MNELLAKISSYNLFNYLLPGIVFTALAGDTLGNPIAQRDLLTAAFLYYFIGLAISRFGSVVIEPILKRIAFVHFSEYKDFLAASEKDGQLAVLSEANNTYRTLSSLFVLLLLLKLYLKLQNRLPFLREWDASLLLVLLLVMFLFSYRKQTSYISKRVRWHAGKS